MIILILILIWEPKVNVECQELNNIVKCYDCFYFYYALRIRVF